MKTIRRGKQWWIIGVPDSITECGPYDTRREADDDRRGMALTFHVIERVASGEIKLQRVA